jgi:hypothetical protein
VGLLPVGCRPWESRSVTHVTLSQASGGHAKPPRADGEVRVSRVLALAGKGGWQSDGFRAHVALGPAGRPSSVRSAKRMWRVVFWRSKAVGATRRLVMVRFAHRSAVERSAFKADRRRFKAFCAKRKARLGWMRQVSKPCPLGEAGRRKARKAHGVGEGWFVGVATPNCSQGRRIGERRVAFSDVGTPPTQIRRH